jgi:hypothetical protein
MLKKSCTANQLELWSKYLGRRRVHGCHISRLQQSRCGQISVCMESEERGIGSQAESTPLPPPPLNDSSWAVDGGSHSFSHQHTFQISPPPFPYFPFILDFISHFPPCLRSHFYFFPGAADWLQLFLCQVQHVINYDFPLNPADYIHRSGKPGVDWGLFS